MPKRSVSINLLPIFVLPVLLGASQGTTKQAIGWVEYVNVGKQNFRLESKVDTGADFSSINGEILKKFTVDGEEWVQFRVESKQNQSINLERKIERYAEIKGRLIPSIKRPVVRLGVCLGNIFRDIEVNLAERKNFNYPMLIGRNFLQGVFLIDSEITHTIQPSCREIPGN
ncbi:MAG: hypothetical protein NPINA01_29020 [Nitrospinaceae bacterium]|nr:MAG: hypothetical protein NPINA01_29020 [Nitrospinaceae bacterium]